MGCSITVTRVVAVGGVHTTVVASILVFTCINTRLHSDKDAWLSWRKLRILIIIPIYLSKIFWYICCNFVDTIKWLEDGGCVAIMVDVSIYQVLLRRRVNHWSLTGFLSVRHTFLWGNPLVFWSAARASFFEWYIGRWTMQVHWWNNF